MKTNALTICTSKKLYITKEDAEKQVKYLWKEKQVDLRIYRCSMCQGFHLTSKK